jgi:hypothetical protein
MDTDWKWLEAEIKTFVTRNLLEAVWKYRQLLKQQNISLPHLFSLDCKQVRRDRTDESCGPFYPPPFFKWKLIVAEILFISWPLICFSLDTLYNNVNKAALRVMTPTAVVNTMYGNFVFLIVTKEMYLFLTTGTRNWSCPGKHLGLFRSCLKVLFEMCLCYF